MPRKFRTEHASGQVILLADDNPEYLATTRRLLEREGHEVLAATNGTEALALLRQRAVDLLLLDYFMPDMNGEAVVAQLRQFNPYVQVILQTGYASEQPPRELLRRLDIQGYFDKGEGPDKLLLWTDVGLKAAYTVQLLEKSRQGLRYILDVTPDLHKIQPLEELLQGLLWQMSGLIGAVNSFLAVLPQARVVQAPGPSEAVGFVAMVDDDTKLVIRAGIGDFTSGMEVDRSLEGEKNVIVRETLQRGDIQVKEAFTVVPLQVGQAMLGVIYLDRPVKLAPDVELLGIFANQAAVAIQNLQLYAMATLDPITGVYVRRFLEVWLVRELRTAFRSQKPLALLMVDVDGLKFINDTAGHLAGDQALATMGKVLRQATRGTDIVGRYGGDEFAVLLPETPVEGAVRVGQRILDLLQDKSVLGPNGPLNLRGSLGLTVLEPHTFAPSELPRPISNNYFQTMVQLLIQRADAALYQAKHTGKNQLVCGTSMTWEPASTMQGTLPAGTDEVSA